MHSFVGDYRVVALCRHTYAPPGAVAEWQARADVYYLNDKTPMHCIYPNQTFALREDAQSTALNAGITWAHGRPIIKKAATPDGIDKPSALSKLTTAAA